MKKACKFCGSEACLLVSPQRCRHLGYPRAVVEAVVPAAAETTARRTPKLDRKVQPA